jgi:hypothetical protein
MPICTGKKTGTKEQFVGDILTTPASLVERLKMAGVPTKDRNHMYYRHFIAYDFEALLVKVEADYGHNTEKTKYTHHHQPLCVGVASSLGASEFIYDEDPKKLVTRFLAMVLSMRYSIVEQVMEEWRPVFTQLTYVLRLVEDAMQALDRGEDGTEIFRFGEDRLKLYEQFKKFAEQLTGLKREVLEYIREVPVVAFNAAKYDIHLIRDTLMEVMTRMPEDFQQYGYQMPFLPDE